MNIWPQPAPRRRPALGLFHDLLAAGRRHPDVTPAERDAIWAEVQAVLGDPAEPAVPARPLETDRRRMLAAFGPCRCGCGEPRRKGSLHASDACADRLAANYPGERHISGSEVTP